MVLRRLIRKLASLDTAGLPITSLYLDTDRRSYTSRQCMEMAHQLVRHVRSNLMSALIADSARKSVDRDLSRFIQLIEGDPLSSDTRGLAVFSSSGANVWEVAHVPVNLTTAVKVGRHAMIRPLVRLADDLTSYAVVVVDREKARFFIVDLGGITELDPIMDDVPGRVRAGSYYGMRDSRTERHVDDHIRQHLKRVADELAAIVDRYALSRVVLGGTADVVPHFRTLVPPSTAARIEGTVEGLTLPASRDEVLRQTMKFVSEAERAEELAIARQIADANGPGGFAVVGLTTTLQAIYAKAVRLLVVDEDLSVGGWRCLECNRLYTGTGSCPECGGDSLWFDDLMDEAIRQAIRQDAKVEVVSDHRSRMRLQGIAAMLHHPIMPPERFALAGSGGSTGG